MDPLIGQIDNWFTFHPATKMTGSVHDLIRSSFHHLAVVVADLLPPGADRTLAIRKLQEAMWAANSAVACGPPPEGG